MTNMNQSVRFRDNQPGLRFTTPTGWNTVPNMLNHSSLEENHPRIQPNCVSEINQRLSHAEFPTTDRRHNVDDFQSPDRPVTVRPSQHTTGQNYSVSNHEINSLLIKSNCSGNSTSTFTKRLSGFSSNESPLKSVNEVCCPGTEASQQSTTKAAVCLNQFHKGPTPGIARKPITNTTNTRNNSLLLPGKLPGTSEDLHPLNSEDSAIKNANTTPVDHSEQPSTTQVSQDCTNQLHSSDNSIAANPLPQWNMRLANVIRYPKYNTRKNSGFERRLKHTGLILDPKLTLRLLRKVLQPFINNAVNNVLQHYMEEYISLAVRNIRDNLGESAVTEKDLMRFRRSVIQRVALQYFAKEELRSHPPTASDASKPPGTTTSVVNTQRPGDTVHIQPVPSTLRMRSKKSNDPVRSLQRQILEHNWGARLDNGIEASNCCTPSPGLSSVVSDGPDSLLDEVTPILRGEKIPVDESTTHSMSAVSSPAMSDRLRLASLKVPAVVLNENVTNSMPVSSQSTSPRTPLSASSCSTLGYFFGTLSHSDDDDRDDRPDTVHHLPPAPPSSNTGPASNPLNDLVDRRRSKRAAKRTASWWNWGSSRRSRTKCPRREHLTTGAPKPSVTSKPRRTKKNPRSEGGQSWNEAALSESTRPKSESRSGSSTRNTDRKVESMEFVVDPHKPGTPRFILNHQTVFTLGSSANAWLGMGAARGRIYTKHPELFRYQCDAEDKAWLVRNGWLTSHGVKAYLMHSDQVKHIGLLNGRIPSPVNGTQSNRLPTFTVPPWLVNKVILVASNQRDFAMRSKTNSSNDPHASVVLPNRPASVDHATQNGEHFSGNPMAHIEEPTRPASHDNPRSGTESKTKHCIATQRDTLSVLSARAGYVRRAEAPNEPPTKLNCSDVGPCTWLPDDPSTGSNHVREYRSDHRHERRSKTEKNTQNEMTLLDSQVPLGPASRSAKTDSSRTGFESRSVDKSPKSPPTLQRFDYT